MDVNSFCRGGGEGAGCFVGERWSGLGRVFDGSGDGGLVDNGGREP